MKQKNVYATYMWQELFGEPLFRFQTSDPAVNKRMRQRNDFTLVSEALNAALWVYRARFYSPREARRTLKRITRREIHFDATEGVYFAETGAVVAQKTGGKQNN